MEQEELLLRFGPADIRLESLMIWVHRRQHPEAVEAIDRGWLNSTVHLQAPGARVWASGPVLHTRDLEQWSMLIEPFWKGMIGEVVLETMEAHLNLRLLFGIRGDLTATITVSPDPVSQEHRVSAALDQSYLPAFVAGCRKVVATYSEEG